MKPFGYFILGFGLCIVLMIFISAIRVEDNEPVCQWELKEDYSFETWQDVYHNGSGIIFPDNFNYICKEKKK